MTAKAPTLQINCWQAFLACMLDLPPALLDMCSTLNEDWRERSNAVLAVRGLFYIEVEPEHTTALPLGALVGVNVESPTGEPHIIIGKVVGDGQRQSIMTYHDPAGFYNKPGESVDFKTLILLCRLTR